MSSLFDPIDFRSITLRNRVVVSPMCQYSSIDGYANDWHLVHLGSRAVGGAALVFSEATAVSPEGRITPDDLGIWKDDHIRFLKRITRFIESHNSISGIQLAHAGRKASHSSPWKGSKPLSIELGGWQTIAPSPILYKQGDLMPSEMAKSDILKVIDDFENAARRAMEAGFKVFEIHGAHGYLINEFLSPLSNQRQDEYGGTFENRTRILIEIVAVVRKAIGNGLPLFVRLSTTDWFEGGWTIEDSVALARVLKTNGVDLIDCSSGGNFHEQKVMAGPLYQVPFAEEIKRKTGIRTGTVGLITTAQQANEIIDSGKADLILLARQMLRDPYFPLSAAKELGIEINWPEQYLRAK
jgi:2,4-dienoyl-CoA reductase-like NADH-dependent reductase (Old Yellow Enzyme family)